MFLDEYSENVEPINNNHNVVDEIIFGRKNKNTLNFGHVNARSLTAISETGSRIDEVKMFVRQYKIDILAVTETHLDDSIDDASIYIEDFIVYRNDRNSRHGGGVALYVKNNIFAKEIDDLFIDDLETLWVEVLINNTKNDFWCLLSTA